MSKIEPFVCEFERHAKDGSWRVAYFCRWGRSGWADRATGMLVIDDGSGQIKDVSQMFSEYFRGTLGVNGPAGQVLFKNGCAALASVDNNADQVIDPKDAIWSQLRVWVDGSHDGKRDAGKLRSCNRYQ